MVNWVVQKDLHPENESLLVREIENQGHNCILIDIKSSPQLEYLNRTSFNRPRLPTIFYGSLSNAAKLKRQYKFIPGPWCNLEKLKCTNYYNTYGKYLINEDYSIVPFGELDRLRTRLVERYGIDNDIFIRPDSGYKIFPSGLLNLQESLSHFCVNSLVFPEELVIVSSPKQISAEWRFVICGQEIAGASQYHRNGLLETSHHVPKEVREYVEHLMKYKGPEPCFVIDIGMVNGKLGIVELNSFSCSGFYECDLSGIVELASLEAQKEFDEYETP